MKKKLDEIGNVVYRFDPDDVREVDGKGYLRIPDEFLPTAFFKLSEEEQEYALSGAEWTPLPTGGWTVVFPDMPEFTDPDE